MAWVQEYFVCSCIMCVLYVTVCTITNNENNWNFRKTDHIGLTIFYKRDKLCLVSEDTFIIHERVKEFMNRVGINSKAAKVLQEHMRESATYPSILDPPGCVFSKLRLIEDNHTTLCIATTHITWKGLRYPILQMLQVMKGLGNTLVWPDYRWFDFKSVTKFVRCLYFLYFKPPTCKNFSTFDSACGPESTYLDVCILFNKANSYKCSTPSAAVEMEHQ